MAIGVESYQLRRVRWPVMYRSKTKMDHDLRFDTSTAPKAYRIASVWILRLRYDTRFHAHVFGGTARIVRCSHHSQLHVLTVFSPMAA
ncbi:hypothetical protein BT69DRAFT_1285089, partial [Atractiella rhizophila]